MTGEPQIVYCHCAYARILPPKTRGEVLDGLAGSDLPFEAVPDLCEMSARRDPRLIEFAAAGPLRIAACYPRAVKWLFSAAGAALPDEGVEVFNMRDQSPGDVLGGLCGEDR